MKSIAQELERRYPKDNAGWRSQAYADRRSGAGTQDPYHRRQYQCGAPDHVGAGALDRVRQCRQSSSGEGRRTEQGDHCSSGAWARAVGVSSGNSLLRVSCCRCWGARQVCCSRDGRGTWFGSCGRLCSLMPACVWIWTGRVLTYALVVSVVTGILFGLTPALGAGRSDLASDLKERTGQPGSPNQVAGARDRCW